MSDSHKNWSERQAIRIPAGLARDLCEYADALLTTMVMFPTGKMADSVFKNVAMFRDELVTQATNLRAENIEPLHHRLKPMPGEPEGGVELTPDMALYFRRVASLGQAMMDGLNKDTLKRLHNDECHEQLDYGEDKLIEAILKISSRTVFLSNALSVFCRVDKER